MTINIKIRADGDKLSDLFRNILLKDEKVSILGINNLILQYQSFSSERGEDKSVDLGFYQEGCPEEQKPINPALDKLLEALNNPESIKL